MQVKTYLISEGVKYTETIIEDGYINKIYKVDNCRKDIYAIPDACIDIQFIYEKGRYVPYACGTHTKVSPAYISGSKKTFAVKFEPGVIPDFMKEYISDIVCDRKCLAYIDDIQNISSMLQNEDDFEKMVDIFMDNFRYDRHFADKKNNDMVDRLLEELSIEEEPVQEGEKPFEGLTFVITGSVEHFANRKELQELIESKGGKASGSVTSKTAYLINNDTTSNSSKNKKAKELGIPIISEKEFLNML